MTSFRQSPPGSAPDAPKARLPGSGDDAGDGLLMFVVFIMAVLTSTAAVVLIALLGEWWVLGFGFAIHVIMTAFVVLTIVQVMAGPRRSVTGRDGPSGTSLTSRRSPASSHQAGVGSVTAATARSPAKALEPAARGGGI
jgi:membrane protein implicated in regulation of membrane protease activity